MKIKNEKLKMRGLLIIILLIITLGGAFGALPVWKAYTDFKKINAHLRPLKDGFVLQNFPQIKRELSAIEKGTAELRKDIRPLLWLKIIPFVGGYYGSASYSLAAGEHLLKAGGLLVETLEPVAEGIGFTTEKKAAAPLSGQERLASLIKIAPVLASSLESIGAEITLARKESDKINPSLSPAKVKGREVRHLLLQGQTFLRDLDDNFSDIKTLLSVLPGILGGEETKVYLVLFQNDKELRPTGGFWTAYALLWVEEGKITKMTSGDMYFLDIDNRVPFYPPAPPVIKKYLKLDDWYIRDTNLSPDYKKSVETMLEFWARVPNVPKVGGVLAVDTVLVEELMGLLGEIAIPNYETFTKDNVVYQLELLANILGSRLEKRGGRKDLLGILMREMINKALALPATEYDSLIAKTLDLAQRKHLLLFFNDERAQALAEKYDFAGRIRDFEGDYLHINDANLAGRKANWYVKEKVVKEVKVARGGRIESTVTIDYENTGDYHPEWNTGYRDYVRVYVPPGSRLLSSDGALEPVESGEELGKTYFAAYIAVNPKRQARLTLSYELLEGVVSEKTYNLLIQKQPGTEGQEYTVKVEKQKESFKLEKDKELRFEL